MRFPVISWSMAGLLAAVATLPAMAQQNAAAAGGASNQVARPYTINPGDQIEVYVWGEERLQRSIRVLPDGSFSFPLVGRIVAQGMLPEQVQTAISNGLASQYRGEPPQVTVSVETPSGFTFSVVGRVRGPSSFTPGRYVNLVEAIAMAGGPDEFANLDNVTIIRKNGNELSALRFRLGGAMKGNLSEEAARAIPQIQTGDTVIVP
ncbi:polysaccharide export outer membrane protein [Sphingobium sp. B1D7B]|uniref:polysaccharide biosynthesis/export family protein n=2 Tax=Sphingomonadaceae TaxID=41297 RepID=UPI00184D358A|nr:MULTISPECIES: polysaccharide biosynthesis/export family protein [Sphingobium]MCW2364230.1 polysaccharide export outer membrane protein [Sphingobium sp. B10D3B]MCW2402373.1 polysaccharide export outer membrane protein [Sphingobium sp. B10D7B]MCW2367259.1 polysaccharide export outer membrane protein [Sphingobium sp. B7D2B]MCW2382598.1 polysaccharide export outer membrane protein [Sphingobium sp. B2D3B]MCW2385453.1 polysaccharide export outer membrane protein [Sphingobium sp. B2D3D]